ncbi:hypothetical protein DsansV1_C20g0164471 [Dioscorea sansibarensis]
MSGSLDWIVARRFGGYSQLIGMSMRNELRGLWPTNMVIHNHHHPCMF